MSSESHSPPTQPLFIWRLSLSQLRLPLTNTQCTHTQVQAAAVESTSSEVPVVSVWILTLARTSIVGEDEDDDELPHKSRRFCRTFTLSTRLHADKYQEELLVP